MVSIDQAVCVWSVALFFVSSLVFSGIFNAFLLVHAFLLNTSANILENSSKFAKIEKYYGENYVAPCLVCLDEAQESFFLTNNLGSSYCRIDSLSIVAGREISLVNSD